MAGTETVRVVLEVTVVYSIPAPFEPVTGVNGNEFPATCVMVTWATGRTNCTGAPFDAEKFATQIFGVRVALAGGFPGAALPEGFFVFLAGLGFVFFCFLGLAAGAFFALTLFTTPPRVDLFAAFFGLAAAFFFFIHVLLVENCRLAEKHV
jgi:hypothetical protein